ncbi:BCCT family transporter [Paracoccus laeviglucosivorans]|uniref:Choline/glycine/proline betaine transport protein n=1 Tax=Paracoccus laeviglucosivorans TaxID=1197861 RepID=A0A521ET44_9RHOB|nr:BCCT family transporter [Paracoccus laeviglucosivorans]SMO87128.1 choline/glycine/proline betaine transport protein [Paracoccus laeviglucosivorans]
MQTPQLKGIAPLSFFGSAIVSLGLIIYASLNPDQAAALFKTANSWIVQELGWFYMLAVGGFVIFLLCLAISPLGKVRLGPDDSTPDYSYGTWIAMLFSAGMGIGIVFYGVAEPIMHFQSPPDATARTPDAARDAMSITFFHWGVHAWAIYAVVGLALAYFGFRRGEPLVIRSAFRPILGDRVNGPMGDIIDIFAVVGTLAGLSTSLGLGVAQLNATGTYLFGLPQTENIQLILIAIVTLLATLTVATGLDNGIRRLSEFILILSFVLMGLILILGPTRFLLQSFVENIGLYINSFVSRTFHIYAYEDQPSDWVGTWTLFYWAWWISWSPFVGLFIARISRGRTIRQFLLGVLFAPAGFSCIWFTIFGDLAIWLDLNPAQGAISSTVAENMPIALFTVFEYLPFSTLLAWLAGLLVAIYFITASDAGALVIAMITSKGDEEPVLWLRVFWALVCGGVAGCLLLAGGLDAVEMAAVIAAAPLSIVMVFMCYGIWKGLSDEVALSASAVLPAAPMPAHEGAMWRLRLGAIVSHPRKSQIDDFITGTATEALKAVQSELTQRAHAAEVVNGDGAVALRVNLGENLSDFVYRVQPVSRPMPAYALTDTARGEGGRNRYYRAEVFLAQGGRGYDIYGYDRREVIADVVAHYDRYLHYVALRS